MRRADAQLLATMPGVSTFIALAFSISLGILFGIYPATRAASLEPIEALRAE